MTFEFGLAMFFMGRIAIFIGAIIAWYVINNFVLKKDKEPTRFDDLE